MDRVREIWFVARHDFSQLIRERETQVWTFVMPILFFWVIGTVTGGMGDPGGSEEAPDPLALAMPADAGFLAGELTRRLEEQNYRVVRFQDGVADTAGSSVRDGSSADEPPALGEFRRRLLLAGAETAAAADSGVGAPDTVGGVSSTGASGPGAGDGEGSFTARALSGEKQVLTLVRRGEGLSLDFDQLRVARAVYGVVADLAVLRSRGDEPRPEGFAELREAPRALGLSVESAGRRVRPPAGFSQAVPGTMVMFTMLVLLTSGSVTLVIEREKGLLRRLASTPISRSSVVAGKWGARLALGIIQIAFAMVVGSLLFGVDWGGSLAMVCVVLLVWAAFNGSLAILLANVADTEAQASGIGVFVSLILAALGGAWWPIEITPGWMQSLAMIQPTGWAMDAMHLLVNFGYGAGAAWPHAAGLLAGAVVAGWVAARTFRYQ